MNKLLKTLICDNQLTLAVLDTTELVNDAIKIHKLSPLSAAALGRTLTVGSFMASGLKNVQDKLTITVAGDGIGGKIVVCGNANLDMRGIIDNPRTDLPLNEKGKLDVAGCVGRTGRITVVKSMGLKEPYAGSCRIVSGEIGEDFTAYYTFSEQQPTAIAVGVKIDRDYSCMGAGAVIIQTLPEASDEALTYAEEIMGKLGNISTLIREKGAEGVLKEYFGDLKFDEYHPKYHCLCSRESIEKILIPMGKAELYDIIEKEGTIKVNCQFCEQDYEFTADDVDKLIGSGT